MTAWILTFVQEQVAHDTHDVKSSNPRPPHSTLPPDSKNPPKPPPSTGQSTKQSSQTSSSEPATHRYSEHATKSTARLDDHPLLAHLEALLVQHGYEVTRTQALKQGVAYDIFFKDTLSQNTPVAASSPSAGSLQKNLEVLMKRHRADYLIQRDHEKTVRRKKLLISDMDSTLIANETLTDLAKWVGMGEAAAAITKLGMEGKIDFTTSLKSRVRLLKGHPVNLLEQVQANIRFNADARLVVETMRAHGAWTILASGGFKPITTFVKETLAFDEEVSNTLASAGGVFTGDLVPPLSLKETKREKLLAVCQERSLPLVATLAVGDGDNDLAMLAASDLGVLFHGSEALIQTLPYKWPHSYSDKSVTTTQEQTRLPISTQIPMIRYHSLKALLYFQGYRESEFSVP